MIKPTIYRWRYRCGPFNWYNSARIHMLEQEVVSERDLRSKSDRTKDDVERDLVDALEQLRIANLNNASKDKDLTVS